MTDQSPAPGQDHHPLSKWEIRFRRAGLKKVEAVTVKATSLIQAAKLAKTHLNKLMHRAGAKRTSPDDVLVRLIAIREITDEA